MRSRDQATCCCTCVCRTAAISDCDRFVSMCMLVHVAFFMRVSQNCPHGHCERHLCHRAISMRHTSITVQPLWRRESPFAPRRLDPPYIPPLLPALSPRSAPALTRATAGFLRPSMTVQQQRHLCDPYASTPVMSGLITRAHGDGIVYNIADQSSLTDRPLDRV